MRRIVGLLAGVFLLLGMAVLLYNPLMNWVAQKDMNQAVTTFEQVAESTPNQSTVEETESDDLYQNLLEDMRTYNTALYENGQNGLTDAWSYEQAPFDLSQYGLATDVMGVLQIPAMDEELPVYLGATEENLEKGVAVLGQTSMPVGGLNTNCVIVGHRGYNGTPFFRDIEKLQPGDPVYLTTYWGEKTYQVESTAIILPDDLEAVLIQEGRELLTLVTCHPYVTATHRYVVYCTAVEEDAPEGTPADSSQIPEELEGAQPDNEQKENGEQGESSSSQRRIQLEQWLPILAVPLVVLVIVIVVWPSKRKKDCQERRKK